jgi:acyl carrier protein
MTPVTTAKPKTAPTFPAAEIEDCISDFLADEGAIQADLHGSSGPKMGLASSVGPQPVIDSLVVVEVLLEVEPKVPFELPESLVRAGGYDSIDEVVQHLMPRLEKRWRKYHEEEN